MLSFFLLFTYVFILFAGVSQVLRKTISNEQALSRQSQRQPSYSPWQAPLHRAQVGLQLLFILVPTTPVSLACS